MKFIYCQNYTAIKIYREEDEISYELFNEDIDSNKYSTTDDELICNIKNVPCCYIGADDDIIYCNRVRDSLEQYKDDCDVYDFNDTNMIALRDLLAYGEKFPCIHITIKIESFWDRPFDNIERIKPKYYEAFKLGTHWEIVDTLNRNNIYWLLDHNNLHYAYVNFKIF